MGPAHRYALLRAAPDRHALLHMRTMSLHRSLETWLGSLSVHGSYMPGLPTHAPPANSLPAYLPHTQPLSTTPNRHCGAAASSQQPLDYQYVGLGVCKCTVHSHDTRTHAHARTRTHTATQGMQVPGGVVPYMGCPMVIYNRP